MTTATIDDIGAEVERLRQLVDPPAAEHPCWCCGRLTASETVDVSMPGHVLCAGCLKDGPRSGTTEARAGSALAIALGVNTTDALTFGLVSGIADVLDVKAWCDSSEPACEERFCHLADDLLELAQAALREAERRNEAARRPPEPRPSSARSMDRYWQAMAKRRPSMGERMSRRG